MNQPSSLVDAPIKFGTDGWRAVIGDDFTYANLRKVAWATARVWLQEHPASTIVMGYDTRFQADVFARAAAEVFAACGITVLLSDRYIPTPGLCCAVAGNDAAIGGIQLTASHNPAAWLGFKIRMADGGAAPVEFTDRVEAEILALETEPPRTFDEALIVSVDLVTPYLDKIMAFVDGDAIASYAAAHPEFRLLVDPLYGAGRAYLAETLRRFNIDVVEIHSHANPGFNGLHPEPIPPWTNKAAEKVLAHHATAAFVTDGDADRIGALDETGAFVSPHRIIALVAQHLVEDRHMSGSIVKTLSTSVTIDRLGAILGCKVRTTPIGFKWIYEQMLKGDVLIGGEESGGIGIPSHVRERDGLLMALLLTEMMAYRDKTLKQLVDDLLAQVGEMYYSRRDLRVSQKQMDVFLATKDTIAPSEIAGHPVREIIRTDGVKFLFDNDEWLLLRPSGTEPLVRVYSEANSAHSMDAYLDAGCLLAEQG